MRGKIIVTAASKVETFTEPTVISMSLTGNTPATVSPTTILLTFNETVTGLSVASFQTTNGNVTNVAGTADSYTLTVVPTTDGPVIVTLLANSVTGTDGDLNSQPTTYTFPYTTSTVVATLTGLPSLNNLSNALEVTVGGANVTRYRYKIGPSASTDCTSLTSYSDYNPLADKINSNLAYIENGTLMKICVLGRDNPNNIDQPTFAATQYIWTQNSPATIEFATSSQIVDEDETNPLLVTFKLSHIHTEAVTLKFSYTGAATYLLDHNLLPSTVTIPAGQSAQTISFSALGNLSPNKDRDLILSISEISTANVVVGERRYHKVIFRDNESTTFKTISNMALGTANTCIVYTNGELYCWGANPNGEVGNNTIIRVSNPTLVGTGFAQVDMKSLHTCGIKLDGSLYCWGDNALGKLGRGTGNTTDALIPTLIDSGTSYSQISTGYSHTCGITVGKKLKCWGNNDSGRLGDGTTTQRGAPTLIDATSDYKFVSAGVYHTCAIKDPSEELYCWGANNDGQLGDGWNVSTSSVPVLIDSGEKYKFVSASGFGSCGITTDDVLKCWGYNYVGEVGVGYYEDTGTPHIVDPGVKYSHVSMAHESNDYGPHTCGVTLSGVAKCWGADYGYGTLGLGPTVSNSSTERFYPSIVDPGETYKTIHASTYSNCGITTTDEAKCWGFTLSNYIGGSSIQESPRAVLQQMNFKSFATGQGQYGSLSYCALTSDGKLYCRKNDDEFLSSQDAVNTYLKISEGLCGLLLDGTLNCSINTTPTTITPGTKYKDISGTFFGTYCAIDMNDDLYCWGKNYAGQVGNNSTTDVASPTLIDSGVKYKFIVNGHDGTCGITTGNRAKCWGEGPKIGDGTTSQRLTPTLINDNDDYLSLSVDFSSVCGITTLQKLKCWGYQTYGQLGNGVNSMAIISSPLSIDSANNYLMVSSGGAKHCAIDSNNKLKCWGSNSSHFSGTGDGTLGVGVLTSNILVPTAVDASENYQFTYIYDNRIFGITTSGKLNAWGDHKSSTISEALPFSFEQYLPTHTLNFRDP